jgi:type III secretion system YseE family protein
MASNGAQESQPALDFGMTDLEERLRGPEGPAAIAQLRSRFEQLRTEIRSEIASGLPPDQFTRAQALGAALAAAGDMLSMLARLQPRG